MSEDTKGVQIGASITSLGVGHVDIHDVVFQQRPYRRWPTSPTGSEV